MRPPRHGRQRTRSLSFWAADSTAATNAATDATHAETAATAAEMAATAADNAATSGDAKTQKDIAVEKQGDAERLSTALMLAQAKRTDCGRRFRGDAESGRHRGREGGVLMTP